MNIIRRFVPSSWINNGQSSGEQDEPKVRRGYRSTVTGGGDVEGSDFPKRRLNCSSESLCYSTGGSVTSMRDIRPSTPQRLHLTEFNDNSSVHFKPVGRGGYSVVYEDATESEYCLKR